MADRSKSQVSKSLLIPAVLAGGVAGYVASNSSQWQIPLISSSEPTTASTACDIKGNISTSGERIYHVPGQAYYAKTVITPAKGERWFCSEAEAVAAGWRRSKV